MEDKADSSACQKVFLRWRKEHASGYLRALDQLVVFYWLVLTKLSRSEVRTPKSLEQWTYYRQVFRTYLQRHQLENQLESQARWREQWCAQHEWVQTAWSRLHQTEEQESDEPPRHPGWRKRRHCPASEQRCAKKDQQQVQDSWHGLCCRKSSSTTPK